MVLPGTVDCKTLAAKVESAADQRSATRRRGTLQPNEEPGLALFGVAGSTVYRPLERERARASVGARAGAIVAR